MIFQAVAAAAGVHQASNGFLKKLATKSLSRHSTLRTELTWPFFNPKFNQIPEKIWEEHSKKNLSFDSSMKRRSGHMCG